MRVITQNISQRAADPDGFVTNQTDVSAPYADLTLDGVLASTNVYNGNLEVDLSDGLGVLVGFTTGATGSVATATITGRNQFGNPITEDVVLPGAAATVSSTEIFSFIESISVDGAYTNLSVGIIAADAQYAPWAPHNVNSGDFLVTLDIELVSGTVNLTLEHTVQEDLLINGPEPDSAFDDTTIAAATATTQGVIDQPVTASRVRINSGSSAVLRIKYLQQGGGYR